MEKIRLTVFLLDSRGLGVSNQKVIIMAPTALQINEIQAVTDESGKAIFDSFSSTSNIFQVQATTNDQILPQKVTINFHQ